MIVDQWPVVFACDKTAVGINPTEVSSVNTNAGVVIRFKKRFDNECMFVSPG